MRARREQSNNARSGIAEQEFRSCCCLFMIFLRLAAGFDCGKIKKGMFPLSRKVFSTTLTAACTAYFELKLTYN